MRPYIRETRLVGNKQLRDQITFSDETKIRIYDDRLRPGIRLRGTFDKWSQKMEFPTDTDLTVRLPLWSPSAVKQWRAFEALTVLPDDTSITWRVSNDTNDYWWDGAAWDNSPAAGEWNTEAEICDNLPTFPISGRKIQLIARLTTTDIHVTPILIGYRFLINALYDPWEDLLRTIIRSLKTRLSYVKDHPGAVTADTSTVNIQTESAFIPEEKNLNVTDIDAVYNHDTDPGHDTDILDSFNSSTGEVTLTGAVTSGTTLWLRLVVVPDIKANFTSMDWTEVGKVPAVVIDTMEADSGQTRNSAELIDKGQGKAYRMKDSILIRELSVGGVLLTGKTRDQMRLQSALWGGIWNAPLLTSVALDVPYTFRLLSPLRFNPRANLSELRQTSFEASIKNVHLWLSDLEELPIVSTFNYSLTRQGIDRPVAEKIQPLSAGAVPGLVPGEPHEEP